MSRELGKHKRSKSEGENKTYQHWDQFLASKRGQVVDPASFEAHNINKDAYHTNNPKKQALNHPAYTHHLRELVTYKTKRPDRKPSCKYGQYKDGSTVKCIRSHDHHAKDHPDTRKQNGNQFRRRRGRVGVAVPSAPRASLIQPPTQRKSNREVEALKASGGALVEGKRSRTLAKK